ncbi:fimbrial protein [Erwinia piriflorinigrans]|uniref:Fimbrin-like protein fimI n=1 Tax=Erwinia piriflorinigrans CFBP 5888 TaxID=1161919 RepID=V5ZBC3_9GAMM|nr:fimbrial protein [Erwinia piriflorinigrans]CCG88545.1 Fimbrin-like protein fimI [Erwinia piriflorinigrans CFBP 5888]
MHTYRKRFSAVFALSAVVSISNPAVAADNVTETKPPVSHLGGTLHLQGSVVNTPCVIDNSSASQSVELGQLRTADISDKNAVSSPVDFAIKLIGCASDTYSKASVTFSGNTLAGNARALAPVGSQANSSVAKGIGIQILQDGKAVQLDGEQPTMAKSINARNSDMKFQAQYIALGEATEVTPGAANANVSFTVHYQ